MASDPRDYKLDLSTTPTPTPTGRPFLSVTFACCQVYQRVYQDRDGKTYSARCPRCGRQVTFRVGPGGTDQRSFVVE